MRWLFEIKSLRVESNRACDRCVVELIVVGFWKFSWCSSYRVGKFEIFDTK